MKKNEDMNRHLLFLRFLLPYIAVMMVPFMLGAVLYYKTIQVSIQSAEESNISALEQCRQVLDSRISEIRTIALQQISNPLIQNFQRIVNPFEYPKSYSINETRQSLKSYKISNNFILDYFILFNVSELVLGTDLAYPYHQFYDLLFKYDNVDYDQWYETIRKGNYSNVFLPSAEAVYNGRAYNIITYMQSLSDFQDKNYGNIMVIIDNREVQKLLGKLNISNGGWAYVADEQNRIISSISYDNNPVKVIDAAQDKTIYRDKINGSQMLVTSVYSDYSKLRFVAVQPESIVLSKVEYIKSICWTIALITLFLGCLISYIMAYRYAKPVREIMGRIMNGFEKKRGIDAKGEFEIIRTTISDLLDDNETLQNALDQQTPFLRVSLIGRLLKGEFYSKTDVDTVLKHVGIDVLDRSFFVTILNLREVNITKDVLQELSMRKVVAKEAITEVLGNSAYLYDLDENKIAVLVVIEQKNEKEYKALVEGMVAKLEESIPKNYFTNMVFAVGGLYRDILDLSRSTEEALKALNQSAWKIGDKIIWYDDMDENKECFFYPSDIENKLINSVKAGDKKKATTILREVYSENIIKRNLSINTMNLFINDLWATVIKIIDQIPLNDSVYNNIKKNFESLEEVNDIKKIQLCMDSLYHICDNLSEHKKSHNMYLKDSVIRYITNNYMKPDLSLAMVAQHFNLSEVYLSQFFKQQTGENFSTYLESLRMKHAKELLMESNLTISEIAGIVGYYTSNTFCRAFKRINGINATACRSSKQEKSITLNNAN